MTTARPGLSSRSWARLSPRTVHLASLVFAAVVIAYLGRRQYFYFDEWTFLIPASPGLFVPHGGHLTFVTEVVIHAVRAVFGVHSYLPYLSLVIGTHLLLVHLLWRVMIRARVDPWIATALGLLLLLFGTGSENIFWAFQFCFIGAMCCGVATILLVTRERLGPGGAVAAAVITAIGLATAGTSLPLVAAAIVLALRFRGVRATIYIFIGPVVLYLIWFVTKPAVDFKIATPQGTSQILMFIPQYVGAMFSEGFGRAIPVPGIGVLLVACLVVWVGARSSRLGERQFAVPAALLGAAVIFAALTGYARFGVGLGAAASGRYVYLIVAVCLPAIGAGATALVRRRVAPRVLVVLLVLATTGYNLGVLMISARDQARIEQGTRRQVSAALAFALRHPDDVDPTVPVDSKWAHALSTPQLLGMHDRGWIDVGDYRRKDLLNALVDIAVRVVPGQGTTGCKPADHGSIVIADQSSLTVSLASAGSITLKVEDSNKSKSRPRVFARPAGRQRIENKTGQQIIVAGAPAGTQYCASA